jgi:DNA mismatch repair protein MutL
VRFRDPGLVRGLIVGAIREALAAEGIRTSTRAAAMAQAFRPGEIVPFRPGHIRMGGAFRRQPTTTRRSPRALPKAGQAAFDVGPLASADARQASEAEEMPGEAPLGAARAQIHENYIVAQTRRFAGDRRPARRP